MAFYAIVGRDRPDMARTRAEIRETHRAYLRQSGHPVRMIHGGPLLAEDGETMIGSLLIVEAGDRAAVEAFVADEPYGRAGLFETLTIDRWAWSFGRED